MTWLEASRLFIQQWLDPIGVVVGIVLAVPVVWTWWDVVIGRRRRMRQWHRDALRAPGRNPGILIVDLLTGKDIRTTVDRFRQQDEVLRSVGTDRIVSVLREARLTPTDMPDLLQDLRSAVATLTAAGVDTIHYFHSGPSAVAACVGAELANGCRVLLYQHDAGGYHNFGPLRMEA